MSAKLSSALLKRSWRSRKFDYSPPPPPPPTVLLSIHLFASAISYAGAVEAFKKEALSLATAPGAPPAFTGAEERGVFEDVLLYNVANGDPERYVNEFGTLAAWADSSLDMYKVCCLWFNSPLGCRCFCDCHTQQQGTVDG